MVKGHAYCGGYRVGLGSDKVDGLGVSSLKQRALLASEDSRCDGSKYFDYSQSRHQCKCPTTNKCGNGVTGPNWTIYRYGTDTPSGKNIILASNILRNRKVNFNYN